ncbi:hypothetical protein ERO13_A03G196700v2 [Gossypium hirsutum]|nr:hypothetical protein ERO13_A03G196700v2 [Gossypium hirsutum]
MFKRAYMKVFLLFRLCGNWGFTGRQSKFVNMLAEEVDAAFEEISVEGEAIHERLLRANTKDYGRYDPTPALVKPPFKLIPN